MKNKRAITVLSVFILMAAVMGGAGVRAETGRYDGRYSGTQRLSGTAENRCVIFGTAPSINLSDGTVSGSGLFRTTTGHVSGNQVVFEDQYSGSRFHYSGSITKGTRGYRIEGVFYQIDGPVCQGTFAMTGSAASESETAEKAGILGWLRGYSPVQDLLNRRAALNRILESISKADKPGYEPGEYGINLNSSLAGQESVLSVPLTYSPSRHVRVSAELPLVWVDDEFRPGNITGSAVGLMEQSSWKLFNELAFDLPTGDRKITTDGFNFKAGQTWVADAESNRFFLNYAYSYRGEAEELKIGDIVNASLGVDVSLDGEQSAFGTNTRLYGMILGSMFSESTYRGDKLDDQRTLLDLSFGLLRRPGDLQMGFSIPVYTKANFYQNADRVWSLDVGYRFD